MISLIIGQSCFVWFGIEQLIVFFEYFQKLSMCTDTMYGDCSIDLKAQLKLLDEKIELSFFAIYLQYIFSKINADFPYSVVRLFWDDFFKIFKPMRIIDLVLKIVRMNSKGRNDHKRKFLVDLIQICSLSWVLAC